MSASLFHDCIVSYDYKKPIPEMVIEGDTKFKDLKVGDTVYFFNGEKIFETTISCCKMKMRRNRSANFLEIKPIKENVKYPNKFDVKAIEFNTNNPGDCTMVGKDTHLFSTNKYSLINHVRKYIDDSKRECDKSISECMQKKLTFDEILNKILSNEAFAKIIKKKNG